MAGILILLSVLSLIYALVTLESGNIIKAFRQMANGLFKIIFYAFITLVYLRLITHGRKRDRRKV